MAHLLTGLRLLAVAPAAWAFSRPDGVSVWVLVALMTVAIVTDYYDGAVARSSGTASARGLLFDHSTDFLFVTSGLAGASLAGVVPTVLPVLIVVAFTQYVVDSYFLHRQKQLRMSTLGRWNGILYFAPLVQIALSRVDALPALADLASAVVGPSSLVLVLSTVASIVDRAVAPLRARAPAR
jgi:CDP-diacylglycerol---glycerol-3-phosphate 3-phosphatidyltransferase